MQRLLNSWNLLSPQKQLVLVLAILATTVTLFGLVRLATKPQLVLLYSGLNAATTSEIVSSLDQKSIAYEVRGNAIYVDSSQRDRTRLSLAGEGLPSNGIAGYELLDSLSGFGTTSQMFDATYWRAKEGELARTILASDRITMARVHIANPVNRPFERNAKPSASVTVTASNGALDTSQGEAIRYLVAAAVSGLVPEQVTVIDTNYGVILQPGKDAQKASGELDIRSDALRANVERMLSARVGPGNAIVEVMVEAQTESEVVTERILDPNGKVAVSSESENNTDNSTGGNGGAVTVSSNLPDSGATSGNGQNSRNQSETRETVNYDISETVRERTRQAGDIARLSVAVLVNGEYSKNADGTETFSPRSDEELLAFQALVKSAVGFNEARGDVVTIETMQFPKPPELGTIAKAGMLSNFVVNIPLLIQMGLLGLVAIVIGMFVVRPILLNPAPKFAQIPGNALRNPEANPDYIDGSAVSVEPDSTMGNPDPIEILRETIAKRSDESSHLLRNWIESEPVNQEEQVS